MQHATKCNPSDAVWPMSSYGLLRSVQADGTTRYASGVFVDGDLVVTCASAISKNGQNKQSSRTVTFESAVDELKLKEVTRVTDDHSE